MNPSRARRFPSRLTVLAATLAAGGLLSLPALAAPEGGVVRAGNATIRQSGNQTNITQNSDRAIIDWRSFGVGSAEQVLFAQPSRHAAVLNRVTGEQLSVILGRIDANGQVFLVNPNGILVGSGAQVNVGSLVASTANISNANFMAGRLVFDEPGKAGARIVNQGGISAAEGGLVALVAPHVRNDGLIQARLGKVTLGAADTFTLDLYGDGLVNLAISPQQAEQVLGVQAQATENAIEQAGRIEADGGKVVLVTAPVAKAVLDQVINLTGTVRADAVQQRGGSIVLLARGGTAQVNGSLSARGQHASQTGGSIEVLGDSVHLGSTARVDASGQAGGGSVRIGGAFQGRGDTWRAQGTTVDAGARLLADAGQHGSGGDVVLWSDGHTAYAGSISARGGSLAGDGGSVEVSGKRTLDFAGMVDAGAAHGAAGTLLLDPATLDIGTAQASLISRVLRTGTSTSLSADIDINVNAAIDGRGRLGGGGLTLNAGNDINVNDFIVTDNGAVNLFATRGTVNVAAGKAVFAGNAPISVRTGGDLFSAPMVTSGALSLASTGGSVTLQTPIDASIGPVNVLAAGDVNVDQPVVNLRNGSGFNATAGGDVVVNAQIDGRGGNTGGTVELAAGGDVRLNEFVITNLADIRARATLGSIVSATGKGLFANGGAIDLESGSDFSTGILSTTGAVGLRSSAGSVTVARGIDATVGAVNVNAAVDANLDSEVLNLRSGAPLVVNAARDVNVRAQIDGRGTASAGGSATLAAGRNVNLGDDITTNAGAISVSAAAGTVAQAAGVQLRSGAAPISVSAGADLTTASYVTTGALNLRSTAGAVTVAEPIYDTTGNTSISAATDVNINALVENVRTLASLGVNAGRDINVAAQIGQDRDATTDTGPITLTAARNVNVAQDVVSRSAPLTIAATNGTVQVTPGKQLRSGSGTLTVAAGGDLYVGDPLAPRPNVDTPYVTTGTLNVSSTGGTLFIEAPIPDSTGAVNLSGGNAVRINERVFSDNQDITVTAGPGGIFVKDTVAPESNIGEIDARAGNLTLLAQGDISAPAVATTGVLRITSTAGRIVRGNIGASRAAETWPQQVRLAGALGIDTFDTGGTSDIEARSSAGSVNLSVFLPARLYVQAAQDVRTGGFIGDATEIVAGRDVILSNVLSSKLVRLTAGQDVLIGIIRANALTADAGRTVRFDPGLGTTIYSSFGGPGGTMTLKNPAVQVPGAPPTVESLIGLSLSAGVDVVLLGPVHVGGDSVEPSTFTAGRNVSFGLLETMGPIRVTANTGNVTVTAPLGAPVPIDPSAFWNPTSLGVASLDLSALGNAAVVSLQGVRAEGDIAINVPAGSVTSAYALTSAAGAVTVTAPLQNISATPVPAGTRLPGYGIVFPAIAPGPLRAAPDAPLIPGAPPPGAPGLPEILVSAPNQIDAGSLTAPAGGGEVAGDQTASQAAATAAAAAAALAKASGDEGAAGPSEGASGTSRQVLVIFTGGRGLAQSADLGRSGSYGSTAAVLPAESADEIEKRRKKGEQR